ncbi:hypothetical protein [Rhizobium sp. CNPSo 3490]|uniref:hypothetical protein n=1 Tax=Rhizobium sp. CNPSo 3490 TaxID=3021407 RepID=UPI00254D153C|nr:hypothetical protein [Rhizobium sp. CNPSo 3490]MDK4731553.1 hypothetical protein [Rhizobium sp. CNPSo 3490]
MADKSGLKPRGADVQLPAKACLTVFRIDLPRGRRSDPTLDAIIGSPAKNNA